MTESDVPAPLISAFWRDLLTQVPDLRTRHDFLRQVAEGAAGPLPAGSDSGPEQATGELDERVPLADGVTLALRVLAQFDGPAEDEAGGPPPAAGRPGLGGRVVARELVRRARRRLPGGQR